MSEQSKAPDVIWRVRPYIPLHSTRGLASWPRKEQAGEGATEYVSRDHCNALVGAAYELSAQKADCGCKPDRSDCVGMDDFGMCFRDGVADIRDLTPTDTQAAYDAAISAARAEGYADALADAASAVGHTEVPEGLPSDSLGSWVVALEEAEKSILALKENTDG